MSINNDRRIESMTETVNLSSAIKYANIPAYQLKHGLIEVDLITLESTYNGKRIDISSSVRRLLYILILNSHRMVSAEELQAALWGFETDDYNAVRVAISRLRKELQFAGAPKDITIKKRGAGVMLKPEQTVD